MREKRIHRIYTEDKNKAAIVRLAAAHFESFTVQPTLGYFKGYPERSIVLEVVGGPVREIQNLAREIEAMNGQKSVLVLGIRGTMRVVKRPSS
jgi:hypothetical protein